MILSDISYQLRLTRGGEIKIVEDEECIHQLLVTMLSTSRGERVMRPNWGADLISYLGEPINEDTAMAIEVAIVDTVQGHAGLAVDSVAVVPDPEGKRYRVHVVYRVNLVQGVLDLALYTN